MSKGSPIFRAGAAMTLGAALLVITAAWLNQSAAAHENEQTSQATRSSPIAVTHDDNYVWSVNPDNDSV
jgi:hypothetical protein